MKTHIHLPILATGALLSLGITGCVTVRNPPPQPVQTVTTIGPAVSYAPGYTVTTLPTGYTSNVYRGTTYYTYNGVYYRTTPRGYTVVTSPY